MNNQDLINNLMPLSDQWPAMIAALQQAQSLDSENAALRKEKRKLEIELAQQRWTTYSADLSFDMQLFTPHQRYVTPEDTRRLHREAASYVCRVPRWDVILEKIHHYPGLTEQWLCMERMVSIPVGEGHDWGCAEECVGKSCMLFMATDKLEDGPNPAMVLKYKGD
ncbi:hypothetical protein MBM_09760 [Drepanopeziza brunnea f. sp. 'multigermtubi' MB_m1]|uniref:Uncharacterized protein n=1 Tax=Marssonina brunnea f. sp. multigermtubi (strain MB_m1) TaxID=1072389 RepID=K1WIR6_MARBU|nr:uncharacterized protein MBM_09760 [Drepanopeziza brunnea f. sp. 'multigermtubi' MB_m1]EKD12067.1 hypothetical protein MBM_09760 [Drepanopeziza brunnea f. sp. 'multigermtubi' MB_m1]